MERGEGGADGLLVAAPVVGNPRQRTGLGAGLRDLAAAEGQGSGRAQAGLHRAALGVAQRTHLNGCPHETQYTTFPTTRSDAALGGTLAELASRRNFCREEGAALLLASGRLADWNSRLCRWHARKTAESKTENTFYATGLSTPFPDYGCRPTAFLGSTICVPILGITLSGKAVIQVADCREVSTVSDVWITDPGYSDSINYAENSEFFLAWWEKRLCTWSPTWYTDSKRALRVEQDGTEFRSTMAECYRNLAVHTPDDGLHVVMFTHQDPEVWADLALVLWSAGLQVTAAWTIATETGAAGIKRGNYVQGTVVLVLRKRQGARRGDFAEVYPEVADEVECQIASMTAIDDKDDPNFGDADYQLAAYAAALRVLTSYARIEDVDVERELRRGKGEASPLAEFIGRTVKIASNFLVPSGLDGDVWRALGPEERFYVKGIDVESKGERRDGVYQEFARGLGVKEYRGLLASSAANEVRLRTPSEFGGRDLGGDGFGGTLLRKVLYAIHVTARNPEHDPRPARDYFHREVDGYWEKRRSILALLRFLAERPKPEGGMPHWAADVAAARLLLGAIENDHP
jgi:putative DNA methylase